MSLAYAAMMFAREAHKAQRRKYTNNPYVDHLAEVAGIVATVAKGDESMLAVAWLHDCVEDQGVTRQQLIDLFGYTITGGVMALSDLEVGSRAARKRLSRERLASADKWIQTIKCADLISNTSSIVEHAPNFAKGYLEEKRLLLDVMTKADPQLWGLARSQAT